tara:strand:+ start:279 stop:572 length:294 start_codon:yes stop_codon:yes gene_type:complete
MNTRILKFIVIILGIIIVISFSILLIAIYNKYNNTGNKNNNNYSKSFSVPIKNGFKFKNYYIEKDNLIIKYDSEKKSLIKIYSIKKGLLEREIEILK